MRTKRKKILYTVFLLITVLMFLHSWKTYINPPDKNPDYVKKHHKQKKHQPLHNYHQYRSTMAHNGIEFHFHS